MPTFEEMKKASNFFIRDKDGKILFLSAFVRQFGDQPRFNTGEYVDELLDRLQLPEWGGPLLYTTDEIMRALESIDSINLKIHLFHKELEIAEQQRANAENEDTWPCLATTGYESPYQKLFIGEVYSDTPKSGKHPVRTWQKSVKKGERLLVRTRKLFCEIKTSH